MSIKYHIETKEAPSVYAPVPKISAMEDEGCLGCSVCVKRTSCIYDVYKNKEFDSDRVLDTTDVLCISCMRCVQECKKNIIGRAKNPQYETMGNYYWRPDLISSIWKQAETGKIPVSGAGYRGPFAGPGFDQMWTDMSEIVRPTRDGIHGREYISTVIQLGRRPSFLEFDATGNMTTELPASVDIPLPIVFDMPDCGFVKESAKAAIVKAATKLNTFAFAYINDAVENYGASQGSVIAKFDPEKDDFSLLKGFSIIELDYSENIQDVIEKIRTLDSNLIISIGLTLDENAVDRALKLASSGAGVLHLKANREGMGLGKRKDDFIISIVKDIHFALLDNSLRDQVTILVSGGIALAEHVTKVIACGADGVVLDTALLVAMECRLCDNCSELVNCPVKINEISLEHATDRIMNLVGAWHAQLLEMMGAMGIREVRRLRGELGRTMFFEDLEKDNLEPVFGERKKPLLDSLKDAFYGKAVSAKQDIGEPERRQPAGEDITESTPTRFRNSLGIYKVVRTSDCISCGKCAEVCPYGVFVKAGNRMLAPKSHLCRGKDFCADKDFFCLNHCPTNALRIGLDPMWQSFGDPRWTAELLAATWKQAETGYPPENIEYKVGKSGGGMDRIKISFPAKSKTADFKPEDVDLSVPINRSGDDRPKVTIGIPFYGGGMSYGSIGLDTIVARAIAYKEFNSFTCTGEGGFPKELNPYSDHVITQVATGLFGVREETIQRVRMVEFKYAQGAKPGLGGHLLGAKNTPVVAKMREAVQGVSLFSPFPFHSVYSVEDHKKHVDWIKAVNPKALVSVKVSGASDVDMVAVGSFYAGAHVVHLDGSYGGTGAAPDVAKKNIAMPIEYAVPKVHRFLQEEGVRDNITLVASGGVRSAWDLAKIIAMGADIVVIGTAELVALECIRCGACESGRGCPRGIATTDPELSIAYSTEWAAARLKNLFHSWSVQLQNILWTLNMKSVKELVGRWDLLEHLDYE